MKDRIDTRYKRYLWESQGAKGKDSVSGGKKCDKCGARISIRNINHSKWGKHITLCNACKKKE